MTAETPLTPVLSQFWDDSKSWTLETYREHDGYRAFAKALTMGPDTVLQDGQGLGPARPRRRRVRDRHEMGLHSSGFEWEPARNRTIW